MMFRTVLTAFMCLVLIGTSGAMAVARGQMAQAPGMEVVLCIGHGTQTVLLDENGEPVDARHICPDCALLGLASVGGSGGQSLLILPGATEPDLPGALAYAASADHSPFLARGPPILP